MENRILHTPKAESRLRGIVPQYCADRPTPLAGVSRADPSQTQCDRMNARLQRSDCHHKERKRETSTHAYYNLYPHTFGK